MHASLFDVAATTTTAAVFPSQPVLRATEPGASAVPLPEADLHVPCRTLPNEQKNQCCIFTVPHPLSNNHLGMGNLQRDNGLGNSLSSGLEYNFVAGSV